MMTAGNGPIVTVIMVCYREGELLYRAMKSLDCQTDKDFNIVLVNDASSCAVTNRICREFSGRSNVQLIMRGSNGGLSAARNDGFAAASEGVCMPVDADDELPPRAVEFVRLYARNNSGAHFLFGNYIRRDVEANEEEVVDCSYLSDGLGWLDPRHLARQWGLLGTSPCFKKTWEQAGRYRRQFSHDYQDVDFWMQIVGEGCRGVYIPETIYVWHRSSNGMNAAMQAHRFWEVALVNRKFQKRCGDWNTTCEGFLSYVISHSSRTEARSLMWRYGWRVWPRQCRSLYFRAWIRMVIPHACIEWLVRAKKALGVIK